LEEAEAETEVASVEEEATVVVVAEVDSAAVDSAVEEVNSLIKLIVIFQYLNFLYLILGFDQGPPEQIVEVATFQHSCEGLMICNVVGHQIPLLMRSIYLANKNKIGKVDDVFGPMSAAGLAI
jgi:hypothetical protein